MTRAPAIRYHHRAPIYAALRTGVPGRWEVILAVVAALLSTLSFPDFNLWFVAWIGLAPLLFAVARTQNALCASFLGWLYGMVFFYGTCWWLTYPMIHYAHISAWLAYPLFLLPISLVALFPALSCGLIFRSIRRFGPAAIFVAPFIWISLEWLRYLVTGQLWNALGYSQAFHPMMIQSARWGGVYAVSFLIVLSNCAITTLLIRRTYLITIAALVLVIIIVLTTAGMFSRRSVTEPMRNPEGEIVILAVQPNVPMDTDGDPGVMNDLLERHLALSKKALGELNSQTPARRRLIIWPESPMNFSYSRDPKLREIVANLARTNQTYVLLNSLEPAAAGGDQNSAILVNQEGGIAARYDKIRLMPFGEYVPLPRWLPGASSVRGLVGEFTPGSSYTLMPLGAVRAGVFICIEAAHPSIARTFTHEGADVLINISNDGYLGPTAVMSQHLSNAIFRAVENDRQVIRVTNSGISAQVGSDGSVWTQTTSFQAEVRTWSFSKTGTGSTFYTLHGDVFVYGCALISLGIISASFMRRRTVSEKPELKRGQ